MKNLMWLEKGINHNTMKWVWYLVGVVKLWVWFVVVPKIGFEKLATMLLMSQVLYLLCSGLLCCSAPAFLRAMQPTWNFTVAFHSPALSLVLNPARLHLIEFFCM